MTDKREPSPETIALMEQNADEYYDVPYVAPSEEAKITYGNVDADLGKESDQFISIALYDKRVKELAEANQALERKRDKIVMAEMEHDQLRKVLEEAERERDEYVHEAEQFQNKCINLDQANGMLQADLARLRTQNEEMRKALEEIADKKGKCFHSNQVEAMAASNDAFEECAEIAREVLAKLHAKEEHEPQE